MGTTDKIMRVQKQHIVAFAGFSLFLLVQILGFHSSMDLTGIPGVGERERTWYMFAMVITHVVAFTVAAIVWRGRGAEPLDSFRSFAVITTTIGLVGFAVLYAPIPLSTTLLFVSVTPFVILGAVLIGLAMALCSLYWLQRLKLFSYRGSYLYLLSGHATATCLCALILLAPPYLGSVIAPLCFAVSNLCLARTMRRFLPSSTPAKSAAAPAAAASSAPSPATPSTAAESAKSPLTPSVAAAAASPSTPSAAVFSVAQGPWTFASLALQVRGITLLLWRDLLSVCIFALLSGLVSRLSGQTAMDPLILQGFMLAAGGFVLVIMSIPALLTSKPLKLENSYFVALPLSALSFLVVPSLISSIPAGVNGILVTTGYMLVGIVLYCAIAETSRFTNIPSSPLFAACGALTLACYLLGLLLAYPVSRYVPDGLTGILIIGFGLFYLVILGAVSLLNRPVLSLYDRLVSVETKVDEEVGLPFASAPVPTALTDPTDSTALASGPLVAEVAESAPIAGIAKAAESLRRSSLDQRLEEFDLSEREYEIVLLLARGRTLSRIGEDLYLSTSAIKYHTHNIYRKLGVHSRRELSLLLLVGISPAIAAAPFSITPTQAVRVAEHYGLTVREQQVLELLVLGWSASLVADTLGVSQNTARSHIKRVYRRLGVHSRQELLDLLDKRKEENSP
jgi:DNA-binding NarL/FixJ family response regulator